MNYEIVQLDEFTSKKATIYSVLLEGEEQPLLYQFIETYYDDYKNEIEDIANTLEIIGHKRGAQENLFKLHEGKLGDGVVALFDEPERNLRLYAIRNGNSVLIIGGGGVKPKNIKAWQEDIILKAEAEKIIKISKEITQRIKDREIWYSEDGMELLGNLTFFNDDQE